MKKLLSLSAGIFFAGFIAAQAIPNGGFENWSNISWYDLNNYENSNDQNIARGFGVAGVTAIRATPGMSGNYALTVKTIQIGADTVFGYVTNSYQNPLQGIGGIQWGGTNATPTGISFYYQCSVQLHDTSGVMVVFKRSGSIIGTYMFPFIGNVGTYTLFSNAFVPALAQTPDTVILAVISSVPAVYDNNNTKGCLPGTSFTIDSVKFTGAGVSNPAKFNGNFENWTADTGYIPTSWYATYPGVFQTTDFHAGSYAVQLTTNIPPGNNSPQAGVISTGPIYNAAPNAGGFPYTQRNDTLEFYYKYTPATAGDSGVVYIELKNGGHNIGGNTMELKPAASYTLQKVGFSSVTTPDSVIVAFSSSKTFNPPMSYVGSVLKVDNVMFKSNPLSVLSLSELTGIKIYPNPVTNSFNLNTEGFTGSVQSVDVYDMMGRAVISVNYASGLNTDVTSFDMCKTAPGIYIVKVNTSTGVFYQKINKVQ